MKNLSLLVWLTQLGISVAIPPFCFIALAVWLRNQWGWGQWVIWIGIALGFIGAVQGFINSIRAMKRLSADKKDEHAVGFNEHE